MLAHPVQGRAPHLHHPVQLIRLIHPVRPLVHFRVSPQILIRHVAQILRPGVVQNAVQRGSFVTRRKLPIAVIDRDLVPVTNTRLVSLRQINEPFGRELFKGVRIVHHGNPALGAVVVIVPQPQRVPHFVRRQLPDAFQRRLVENIRLFSPVGIGRKQPFKNQIILPVAQRTQRYRGLDNFACARV